MKKKSHRKLMKKKINRDGLIPHRINEVYYVPKEKIEYEEKKS